MTDVHWVKILADNWRGRNGNSTTGDSVRNSCADELEKVAAKNGFTGNAQAPGTQTFTEMRNAIIEECAKIAEPWAGFWLDKYSTDADRAVVEVRKEIAAKIRGLAVSSTVLSATESVEEKPTCQFCGAKVHQPCSTKPDGCELPSYCFPSAQSGDGK